MDPTKFIDRLVLSQVVPSKLKDARQLKKKNDLLLILLII